MTKQEAISKLLIMIAETYYGDNNIRRNPELQELINLLKEDISQEKI